MGISSFRYFRDFKVLKRGTFSQTGNGTYQDIVTIDVPILNDGEVLKIESFTQKILGAELQGIAWDAITGDSAVGSAGEDDKARGFQEITFTPFGTSCFTKSFFGTNSANIGTAIIADFDFTAPEQVFLKTINSAVGTNCTIKYLVYLQRITS